ncbi:hypothetical protein FOZ63_020798 [Perkinsus olseni]|uniref:Uncharacterized protein n=1 Tax=Perkinsus olseni TaxID=32597 RepID=A0A7J6N926_PEROL|nr:hypothetical protein FOZ62_007713 [Perkinsus olseni]KAF4734823.1 hypothetical protein FOZ63_020798 [Perkinsus olseni]
MIPTRTVRLIYIVAAMLPSAFLGLRSDKSPTQRSESLGNITEAASRLEHPSESPFSSAQAVVEKDAFNVWFEELVYIHGIQRTEDREADLKKLGRMLKNVQRTKPHIRTVMAHVSWHFEPDLAEFYEKAGFDCGNCDEGYSCCTYNIPEVHDENSSP